MVEQNALVERTKSRLYFEGRKQWDGRAPIKKELLQALDLALEEVNSITSASFALDKEEPVDEEVVRRLTDYYVCGVREKSFERHLTREEAFQVLESLRDGFLARSPEMIRLLF